MREPTTGEKEGVALGFVSHSYQPVQNAQAFAFFEPLVERGWADFHTAGALGEGERVWVLAKLKDQITVGANDTIEKFLLLSNTHNGMGAVTVRFTPIRVVCQNTLNLATKGKIGLEKARHSKRVLERLSEIQVNRFVEITEATFAAAEKLFRSMATMKIDRRLQQRYLATILPRTERQRRGHEIPERWKRIMSILEDKTATPATSRDTLWALYNAVTRDEDYRFSIESSPDRRLDRVWFGDGSHFKVNALTAAKSFVERVVRNSDRATAQL